MKHVDCEMRTKNVNNYKFKTFQTNIADVLANVPPEEVSVVITEDNE